jgi:hypothetical protein
MGSQCCYSRDKDDYRKAEIVANRKVVKLVVEINESEDIYPRSPSKKELKKFKFVQLDRAN